MEKTDLIVKNTTFLEIDEKMSVEEWAKLGASLYHEGQKMLWWQADWAAFGERKYGELKQWCDLNGLNYGSIKNLAWVASSVEKSRRHDLLSFSHHSEVSALEPKEQKKWLAEALREKLSVAELRRRIRRALGEHEPEQVSGAGPAIFGVEKFFLDAEVFLERNASTVESAKDYLWPKVMPIIRQAASVWPDKINLSDK